MWWCMSVITTPGRLRQGDGKFVVKNKEEKGEEEEEEKVA